MNIKYRTSIVKLSHSLSTRWKKGAAVCAALCLTLPAMAQYADDSATDDNADEAYEAMMEVQDSSLYIPESLEQDNPNDYAWTERQYIHLDPDCVHNYEHVPVSDEVYISRLKALPTIIPMPFNRPVKQAITFYLERRRSLISRMVSIGYNYYFPIFENALQRHGLPSELKYLACIESGLRQNAYSRARAAGLWQFIPSTGILKGLEINSYIDERYDLYKSTDAACSFLQQLYNKFQDWHLAIAAYNCGPGNIDKAIARSGGRRTFWEIYNFLPRETRAYVPLFIAATYVMNYHDEHQLCGSRIDIPMENDTVMVGNLVHFQQISDNLHIPIEQIEALNPQYIRNIVPGSPEKQYSITLPIDKTPLFIRAERAIYAYHADSLLPHNGEVAEIVDYGTRNTYVRSSSNNSRRSRGRRGRAVQSKRQKVTAGSSHTVRKGETLSAIAKRNHTTVATLKKANNIRSNNVRAGQKLRIP